MNHAEIQWWCGSLRSLFNATQIEEEIKITAKYRRAFRFLKGVHKGPHVRKPQNSGFVSPDPQGTPTVIKYDGLTTTLDHVFHPSQLGIGTGGDATGGFRRGMEVDAEISALVNKPYQVADRYNYYTHKTVNELYRLGLRPFWAQVPVGCIELNLATALDILCVDEKDGGLVNVQLKTGFEIQRNYTYSARDSFLRSPYIEGGGELGGYGDSHASRHLLQVTAEHLIVQTGYENPLAYSMLMVVSKNKVRSVCVPGPDPPQAGGVDEFPMPPLPPYQEVYENLKKRTDEMEVEIEVAAVRNKHAAKNIRNRRKRFTVIKK